MTRIQMVGEAEATGELAEIYARVMQSSGRPWVSGILKSLSARPDFLKQVMDFSDSLHFQDGHLDRVTKEFISTWVSSVNECHY